MKKLGKLTISPEKFMKNEELINLQGGYYPYKSVYCWMGGTIMCGPIPSWHCGDAFIKEHCRGCPGWSETSGSVTCYDN